jgi:UDP-3-O-[3-hydroxymyristoyl] glucosamine N-acyltransferase
MSDLSDPVFVHPRGLCESDDVGAGTRVWAFAHVMPGASVGRDCNICGHAFVETGARIGDRVTVKNAVLVWDGVEIGDDVFLGPGVIFTNDLRPRAHIKPSCSAPGSATAPRSEPVSPSSAACGSVGTRSSRRAAW